MDICERRRLAEPWCIRSGVPRQGEGRASCCWGCFPPCFPGRLNSYAALAPHDAGIWSILGLEGSRASSKRTRLANMLHRLCNVVMKDWCQRGSYHCATTSLLFFVQQSASFPPHADVHRQKKDRQSQVYIHADDTHTKIISQLKRKLIDHNTI